MKYLIIGGGPCGDSAAKEIIKRDPQGEVTVLSEENYVPYRRLALTKQAWTGPFETISLKTDTAKINTVLGVKALELDENSQTVTAGDGKTYFYDKLLIATGISPRRLPYEGIIYLRTYEDFLNLKKSIEKGKKVTVIGAGFTGLELAGELKKQGCDVNLLFPENIPCTKVLPEKFCQDIYDSMEKGGVNMCPLETAETVECAEGKYKIITSKKREIICDTVVAGIGNTCNIPFGSKLICENGIKTDSYLETNIKNVYAAGDVAQFPSRLFGVNMRKEFMDNAIKSGKCAAANMCGSETEYNPVINTFFDTFDVGYKAVGEYGMNFRVSYKEAKKGYVIFYRNENVLCGVVFWNVKPALTVAAKCIEDRLTLSDEEYLYMMKYMD